VTPAERAEALRLLRAVPALSDAEVARRSGVERRTVSRWRAHPPKDAPGGTLRDVPDVPNVPVPVPNVPAVAQPRSRSRSSDAPTVDLVALGLSQREADALGAYLALKGRTVEDWLAGLCRHVARDVLGLSDHAQTPAVVASPGKVPHAPRCPRCGGPVLIDQAGRRCINRGCTA
jgi:hypothetical protein